MSVHSPARRPPAGRRPSRRARPTTRRRWPGASRGRRLSSPGRPRVRTSSPRFGSRSGWLHLVAPRGGRFRNPATRRKHRKTAHSFVTSSRWRRYPRYSISLFFRRGHCLGESGYCLPPLGHCLDAIGDCLPPPAHCLGGNGHCFSAAAIVWTSLAIVFPPGPLLGRHG